MIQANAEQGAIGTREMLRGTCGVPAFLYLLDAHGWALTLRIKMGGHMLMTIRVERGIPSQDSQGISEDGCAVTRIG